MLPASNISWKELDCKDGTFYPYEFVRDGRLSRLVDLFEDIRKLGGNKPIKVLSAYRTPAWNKKIGGVKNSQHILGRALDLQHSTLSNNTFHTLIDSNSFLLGIGGLGKYPTFVHVDIRPGIKIIKW